MKDIRVDDLDRKSDERGWLIRSAGRRVWVRLMSLVRFMFPLLIRVKFAAIITTRANWNGLMFQWEKGSYG